MSSDWSNALIDEIKAPTQSSIAIGPFGSRMKSDCYVDDGIRVVRGTNISSGRTFSGDFVFITPEKAKELGGANLQPNDLVFPHRGSIGEVGVVPDDGKKYVISSSLMKLTCDTSRALPLFVYYFFKSDIGRFELLKNSSQVGTPGIGQPLTSLKSISIPLPPLREQKEIAGFLGSIDDRIALLRETNTTLEAIAQALFKSWFVDFDPVHANAALLPSPLGESIARGAKPAGGEGIQAANPHPNPLPQGEGAVLPAEIAALFPDSFEESELGLVPKGWRIGSLIDLALLNPESWTTKKHPDTMAYIDLANAKDNEIAEVTEYTFDAAPSRARRVLRNGDTIVGTVRPGNRSFAFIHQVANNLTASTGFAVLRPRKIENTEYIYLMATQDSSIEHLAHVADGGAYPAVRPEVVVGIQCILPSDSVMEAFHDLAAPLLISIAENQCRAKTLATLRGTLLPRLISGQLRLPEAEALIEDIA